MAEPYDPNCRDVLIPDLRGCRPPNRLAPKTVALPEIPSSILGFPVLTSPTIPKGRFALLSQEDLSRIRSVFRPLAFTEQISNTEKEETMNFVEAALQRKAQLEADLKQTNDHIEKLSLFPEDDFEPGTVISFTRSFGTHRWRRYSYAGIKAETGGWYITGDQHREAVSWDALINMLTTEGTLHHFSIATEWDEVLDEPVIP